MILTSKRFFPKEALEVGIADYVYEPNEVLEKAIQFGEQLVKKNTFKDNFKELKKQIYEK